MSTTLSPGDMQEISTSTAGAVSELRVKRNRMITDPRESKFLRVWGRRSLSFSLYFLAWAIITTGLPLIALYTLLLDAFRPLHSSFSRTRCVLFFLLYLNCEMLGIAVAFLIWMTSGVWLGRGRKRFIRMNAWLQACWASALLNGSLKIFSMELQAEGIDCASPGPIILLIRHTSAADTVLASVLIANTHKLLLRFVLKRELLWDPCLDVVGNRLPNVFIDRSGQHTVRELNAIRQLASRMGTHDGVLVYPEGTRFDRRKLDKIKIRMIEKEPAPIAASVERMRYVLPPRPGGVHAVVAAAPNSDIVLCAHTGFEGAASFREFWRGALVQKKLQVCFWRIPSEEIPTDYEVFKSWLFEKWLEIDEWVISKRPESDCLPPCL